jgi:hypothetical protein
MPLHSQGARLSVFLSLSLFLCVCVCVCVCQYVCIRYRTVSTTCVADTGLVFVCGKAEIGSERENERQREKGGG